MVPPGHSPLKKLDLPDPFAPTATHRHLASFPRTLLSPHASIAGNVQTSSCHTWTHKHTNNIDVLIKRLRDGLVLVALVALDNRLHAKAQHLRSVKSQTTFCNRARYYSDGQ